MGNWERKRVGRLWVRVITSYHLKDTEQISVPSEPKKNQPTPQTQTKNQTPARDTKIVGLFRGERRVKKVNPKGPRVNPYSKKMGKRRGDNVQLNGKGELLDDRLGKAHRPWVVGNPPTQRG